MFELDISRDFSAAHRLAGYNGNCSNMHGHNWTVQVFVRSTELDDVGIAMDFRLLKKELDTVLETLDHKNLNEHAEFKDKNPTSENLARYIYRYLSDRLNTSNAKVSRVRVAESQSSGASYSEP